MSFGLTLFLFCLMQPLTITAQLQIRTDRYWIDTSQLNYSLEKLPQTFRIDCGKQVCSCETGGISVLPAIFYRDCDTWLLNETASTGFATITAGTACRVDEFSAYISARLECDHAAPPHEALWNTSSCRAVFSPKAATYISMLSLPVLSVPFQLIMFLFMGSESMWFLCSCNHFICNSWFYILLPVLLLITASKILQAIAYEQQTCMTINEDTKNVWEGLAGSIIVLLWSFIIYFSTASCYAAVASRLVSKK